MSVQSGFDHELLEQLAPASKLASYSNSYRGVALLAELLQDVQSVYSVYHSRFHIIVLLNGAKTLVAFDNVPQWAHPEKIDVKALLASLKSESPDLPHIFTIQYKSPIVHVSIDSSTYTLRLDFWQTIFLKRRLFANSF